MSFIPNSIDGVMIRVIRSWVQTSVGQRQYNWYLLLRGQAHSLKGNFAIFYMLAKYVPGDIKYTFIKFYRHISTNNEANRKFVTLISNFFMGCDALAR